MYQNITISVKYSSQQNPSVRNMFINGQLNIYIKKYIFRCKYWSHLEIPYTRYKHEYFRGFQCYLKARRGIKSIHGRFSKDNSRNTILPWWDGTICLCHVSLLFNTALISYISKYFLYNKRSRYIWMENFVDTCNLSLELITNLIMILKIC